MTPAINAANKAKIHYHIHEYQHDPDNQAFGLEAVEKLNLNAAQVFKTLVTQLDNGKLAVAVVPVSDKLNLKQFAKACGAKKAAMADKQDVQRSSGYVLGGVSPLGQKKALMTVVDISARQFDAIYVSAGRRGLEIELSPDDLVKLTRGTFADIK
ncbi:Cys-tRNA(Pro) deacylase [Neptunicella sp. SCSIO 80796]|uniref:Cys-tRNA(Pro) deacylase n=1 Tax=Neptunicella plasticusilytica TaxID=3117012 RepID=UPI003A4D7592